MILEHNLFNEFGFIALIKYMLKERASYAKVFDQLIQVPSYRQIHVRIICLVHIRV